MANIRIKSLNDIFHYTGDFMSKSSSGITNTKYPDQDPNYVGKVMCVPYFDENNTRKCYRLSISKALYPQFIGRSGPLNNFSKILRFDLKEPYVAILVTENDDIIIGDTREMRKYTVYPGYVYSSYNGFDEVYMRMCESWDEFNAEYIAEKFTILHVQNLEYIGKPVYIEYFKDLGDYSYNDNILPREYYPNPDARISQDFVNIPKRTLNTGYVIRADENGDTANFVVMTENSAGVRRYILGTEAYFYVDLEEPLVPLERLNLWRLAY